MRALFIGVFSAAVAGCAPSARDLSLAGLDLANGATLALLQKQLPQNDRAALGTYALLHWPKSKFYCGEAIGGSRALAAAVGQAIDQTRAYEANLQLAQAKVQSGAVELGGQTADKQLVTRIEQLVYERDMLYAQMGPAGEASPRGAQIKAGLTELRGQLDRLRHPRGG